MAAYASVSNVRLVVRDGEGVAGPARAGADERGPVHVRSGPYSSACRCHRGRTYCCPCTRSPFLLEGFGFAPPSFVLFGLLGEKEFAVLLPDCLATGFLATTVASGGKGRHRPFPTLSGNVASAL